VKTLDATLERLHEETAESGRPRVVARRARNAELRLGDLDRAEALYRAVPVSALDRLRIARMRGDRPSIAGHLAEVADTTADERVANGFRRVLALFHEHGGAPAAAAALFERLASRDPADVHALDGLVRTSPVHRSRTLFARARATAEPPVRALHAFVAGLHEENSGRLEDAESAYTFALEAETELLPVLDAMIRTHLARGDEQGAAALAERAAKASRDTQNASAFWSTAATLHEDRLGNGDQALACWRALLAREPDHTAAFERAFELVESVRDWPLAASMLLARADAVRDAETSIRALARRAAILASKLGDTAGAIADLRRALAIRGEEDASLLEVLAHLEERTKNWQEALQLYGRAANAAVDEAVRRRCTLASARILSDELRDHARAKAIYDDLVRRDPDDRESAFLLANVCARAGEDARALELFEALASNGPPPERARALVAIADLERTRSPAASDAFLARAFDLALTDPAVIPVLEERASRDGDFRPFVTHAEAAVGRVPPGTPGVLQMRIALARTFREKLGNPTAADRHLTAAIQAFPESMSTRLAFAAALRGRNDEAALSELRHAVEYDPTAHEPFEALVTLLRTTGRPTIGAMLATAAAMLGGVDEEVSLVDASPPRPLPDSLLFEEAMARLVGPSRSWLVRGVLAQLEPFLPKIFAGAEQALEQTSRLPDSYPIVSDVRAIAAALGAPTPIVARGGTVLLLLTDPRAIVLSADLVAEGSRSLASFHAAWICARIAGNGSIYTLPRQQVAALVDAVVRPEADGPLVRDLRKRVNNALPRKNKKDLERVVLSAQGIDVHAELTAWEGEEARRALYAAVLLCRDIEAVAHVVAPEALAFQDTERRRALAKNARMREVLEFVVSPACWDAWKRIYGRS
jgi:hypothetical protein